MRSPRKSLGPKAREYLVPPIVRRGPAARHGGKIFNREDNPAHVHQSGIHKIQVEPESLFAWAGEFRPPLVTSKKELIVDVERTDDKVVAHQERPRLPAGVVTQAVGSADRRWWGRWRE